MENILLLALKEIRKHSPESIATHLGISVTEYLKIETGKINNGTAAVTAPAKIMIKNATKKK